jgi:hypothetical protein
VPFRELSGLSRLIRRFADVFQRRLADALNVFHFYQIVFTGLAFGLFFRYKSL